MTQMSPASLQQVKADWLRVKHEMAYVRLLAAAYRQKHVLAEEAKFNPNHDELGRFTTADGVGAGTAGSRETSSGSSSGGNPKIAFAGPAEKAVEAALALYVFLSGQDSADQKPFVQFNAQAFLPNTGDPEGYASATIPMIRVGRPTRASRSMNSPASRASASTLKIEMR